MLALLTKTARAINPAITIAATACAPYTRAYYEAFQDWPQWANSRLVDFILLMSYPANLQDFNQDIRNAKSKVTDLQRLSIALPAYKLKKYY
ncbi:hypothetical protein LDC_0318 [sediment metagenome]|uniref:GH18 domain-containing protein n=1 Tax=sediment metagenome TaxID=749907 RepID=D9PFN4_9ZZZZ